jgi:pyrimidine-specific ribonucleoside hydrolase
MSIPIIIDCDPGHDDAIALLLALASPEVDLLGVTTVAGNSTLDKTTVNALKVLELCDRPEIRVAAGASRPLVRELVVAEHVHGKSGLDGPDLAHPVIEPVAGHAVDFLADRILGSSTPVTLIPVGPLTNIALLLSRYPEVMGNVSRIISMGGAIGTGNITPSAEFNIYVDPEAAHRVYHSGLPITMIGLDVTHQALLNENHAERLRSMGRTGQFVAELLDFFIGNYPRHHSGGGAGGSGGAPIHDAVAVAHVIWPDLVSTVDCHVTVDTQSELCRGRTVVDRWHVTGLATNADVGVAIPGDQFAELLIERISRLG